MKRIDYTDDKRQTHASGFQVTPVRSSQSGSSPENASEQKQNTKKSQLTQEEIALIKKKRAQRGEQLSGPLTESEKELIKRHRALRQVKEKERDLSQANREERQNNTATQKRPQRTKEELEEIKRRREQRQSNLQVSVNKRPQQQVVRERIQKTDNVSSVRKQQVEKTNEQKQRIYYEKRAQIEETSRFFTEKTGNSNYFVNLLIVTFKMFLVCLLIICISGIGFLLGMSKSYLETVPELDFGVVKDQDQATVLMDVNGDLLVNYYNMENREWAKLEEIPDELENAVIAIEDVRFKRHMGIDFKRLFSVALSNLTSGSMQGGSTITQQLIKNTILSFEQTYKRKIQEASLALELERKYSKEDILEAYLNTIYMGGSCYGVKTAAKDYFGKDLSQLTLRECACLAGMIQNPSRYNPRTNFYSRNNPARTNNRTNLVLYEMRDNGLIDEEKYQAARNDKLTVLESSPYSTETGMIYFTDYVIDSVVSEILEDRNLEDNSKNRSEIRKEIRTSGYKIYTTIDGDKQKAAEKAVYDFKNYPKMRYESDSYTVAGRNPDGTVIRLTQPQAAVAVVDYHNGYIVALVGGRQAPTGSLQFNRAYQSTMPVGSSIKPIAVYAPAIENGLGTGTVYYDQGIKINGWDSVNGYPLNNNRTFSGKVTMRKAFVNSLNTSAAQALLYDVGIENSVNTLKNLGVDAEHISATGSGLALGSSGITPLEMAGAFSAIANLGTYIEPIAFTKVVDQNGNTIVDMLGGQDKRKVFSESTAWQVASMMRDVATSGIANRVAVSGQTVYGKTGTNSESRGVFFAGFTGYYTCCSWIGSDAYKPLQSSAQGSQFAGPLFAAVMNAIHKGLPNKAFSDVDPESIGVQMVNYCSVSGKLASEACTQVHSDYGAPGSMQTCDMHKTVEICSDSGALATENCPTEKRKKQTVVLIPEKGMFNYVYYNYYQYFVSVAGTPVVNMNSCKVDHSGNQTAPT
ncbi:MAG: PBP1A family penicillin-binding protein [Clostridiales bacterium]|nr:PBP1A family penicillin-binding protein [Clostridiales bacterium]